MKNKEKKMKVKELELDLKEGKQFGLKDGSQHGMKLGGGRRHRTSECRHLRIKGNRK